MPKLVGYRCRRCNEQFEFLHHPVNEPALCPMCGSGDFDVTVAGGHFFNTIQATSRTSKRFKAGFCHRYFNRPAERVSISVPRTQGE